MAITSSSARNPATAAGLLVTTSAITAGEAGPTRIFRSDFRSYQFVGSFVGTMLVVTSRPLRSYLTGMLAPSLVTMRQVMLSGEGGLYWMTAWPSTARILSPGRRPAFHAGPSGT